MARYPKVKRGDPLNFPAGLQNDLINLLGNGAAQTGQTLATLPGSAAQGVIVRVKNTSGADRARWDCMSLGTALRFTVGTDGKESVIFDAAVADPDKPAAILQEPIKSNKFGRALIFGYTLAKIKTASSSTLLAAKPATTHNLEATSTGLIRLLAAPSDSAATVRPVIVGAGGSGFKIYKYTLTSDMGVDATANLTEPGGSETASGVTLNDTIGLAAWQTTGRTGLCYKGGDGEYYVIVPDCEPEDPGSGGSS